MNGAYIYHLGV